MKKFVNVLSAFVVLFVMVSTVFASGLIAPMPRELTLFEKMTNFIYRIQPYAVNVGILLAFIYPFFVLGLNVIKYNKTKKDKDSKELRKARTVCLYRFVFDLFLGVICALLFYIDYSHHMLNGVVFIGVAVMICSLVQLFVLKGDTKKYILLLLLGIIIMTFGIAFYSYNRIAPGGAILL